MKSYFEVIDYCDDIPVRSFEASIDSSPPHWHEEIEILLVLNGNIHISTSERVYQLKEKDLLVLNTREIHQFLYTGTQNKMLVLQVKKSFLIKYFGEYSLYKFNCCSLNNKYQHTEIFNELEKLMTCILKEFSSRQDTYKNFILCYVNTIFANLFRFFKEDILDTAHHSISNENMKNLNKIFDFVQENYLQDISLTDVSNSMHLSYFYLSHFFKKQTGIRFSSYLDKVRLEKSKELLLESSLSITEVAMQSGFKSHKKLYNLFKKTFNLSPAKYKESKIGNKDSKKEKDYTFDRDYNDYYRGQEQGNSSFNNLKNLMIYKAFEPVLDMKNTFPASPVNNSNEGEGSPMTKSKINFLIKLENSNETLIFAVTELQYFLTLFGNSAVKNNNKCDNEQNLWIFELSLDTSLSSKAFSISCNRNYPSGPVIVNLKGWDSSSVVSAIYTFLEKAGLSFQITGPVLPKELFLDETIDWNEVIVPVVLKRGIRQHINFPMDISSYTLEDAKEYIRNIARMRFNHISFHSYYGQWYRAALSDKSIKAGSYFYGQTHIVPDHPILKKHIDNKDFFCIPEIEPIYTDKSKRSEASINWLNSVMCEAKRVGLEIRLSIEAWDCEHNHVESIENMIKISDTLTEDYPYINSLEFITRECGASTGGLPREEAIIKLKDLLGKEFIESSKFINLLAETTVQIADIAIDAALFIKLLEALKTHWEGRNKPELIFGVYATDHITLKIIFDYMHAFVPEGIKYSFLSSHGARDVYEATREMNFNRSDIAKTMFYSWSEFDGDMFLIQNCVEGNFNMLSHLVNKSSGQVYGYAVNHWRTSENKASLRYVSEITLKGPIAPEEFYSSYGKSLGIKALKDFSKAMSLIDLSEIDIRKLVNVAFSFVGCWINDKLGYISSWDKKHIPAINGNYEAISEHLKICLADTENIAGRENLNLLLNRTECSLIYFTLIKKLLEVSDIAGTRAKEELSPFERQRIIEICDVCLNLADDYMRHHVLFMPDRGCEGTLISFYHTLPAYIKRIRIMYGEGKDTKFCVPVSNDAPPSPEQ